VARYLLNLFGSVEGAIQKVGWVEVIDVLIVAVMLHNWWKAVAIAAAAAILWDRTRAT